MFTTIRCLCMSLVIGHSASLCAQEVTESPLGEVTVTAEPTEQPVPGLVETEVTDPQQELQGEVVRIATADLAEQTRMADASVSVARDSAAQIRMTKIGMWVNGIALLLIFFTFGANAVQAHTAVKAIEQDRAWLAPGQQCFIHYTPPGDGGPFLCIDPTWTNGGGTPAQDIRYQASTTFVRREISIEDVKKPADLQSPIILRTGFLNIGVVANTNIPIDQQVINVALTDEFDILLLVTVTYRTVYGFEGTTVFCQRVIHDEQIPVKWAVITVGHLCSIT